MQIQAQSWSEIKGWSPDKYDLDETMIGWLEFSYCISLLDKSSPPVRLNKCFFTSYFIPYLLAKTSMKLAGIFLELKSTRLNFAKIEKCYASGSSSEQGIE